MARIRTIKPEFWQSEKLAGLSEHARLLAIALLNHADDEGYFMANVALVRAACFPFDEDSRKVLGSLQELSAMGYIAIVEASGKAIGRVTNFLEHQRIDKPAVSKLKALFEQGDMRETQPKTGVDDTFQEDSKNIPGGLQEDSRLEQGTGKGNGTGKRKGEGNEKPPAAPPSDWIFPEGWETEELRQALEDFAAMRKEKKKPLGCRKRFSAQFKNFDDRKHLLYAVTFATANEYQGIKTDYRPSTNGKPSKPEKPLPKFGT